MSKYEILKEYEQVLMKIEDILGSGITSNLQVDRLGFQLFDTDYLGTFSSDEFPKYIKIGQCFILNTESSRSKQGIHWVAFYKYKDGKLYGYDTFNRNVKSLSPYWQHKRIINANIDRDQSYKEYSCGSRSISWILLFKSYGTKIINII